jgi:hypothetical protein
VKSPALGIFRAGVRLDIFQEDKKASRDRGRIRVREINRLVKTDEVC